MRSLEEIKRLRKRYHLNQKELAERAGVSQSLIAKIEAGKLDPTYTKAQQIFAALEELRGNEELKAKQVMRHGVQSAQSSDLITEIIKVMKKKGISQLPVQDKGKICGIITEGTILKKISEYPEKIHILTAREVMEEAPPIVSLEAGQKLLLSLLQEYPIVLVAEKGEIKGIISKSDLLGRIE